MKQRSKNEDRVSRLYELFKPLYSLVPNVGVYLLVAVVTALAAFVGKVVSPTPQAQPTEEHSVIVTTPKADASLTKHWLSNAPPPGQTAIVNADLWRNDYEAQLKSLVDGEMVTSIETPLRVGDVKTLTVLLTRGKGQVVPPEFRKNQNEKDTLQVSPFMTVDVKNPDGHLKIEADNKKDNGYVKENGFTPWSYTVTCVKSGDADIKVIVAVRLTSDKGEESSSFPVFHKTVHIYVNPPYQVKKFISDHINAVVGGVVFPIILLIVGALWRRREGKREIAEQPRIVAPKDDDISQFRR
jgi:hypothetical protein